VSGFVLLADKSDAVRRPMAAELAGRGLEVIQASDRGQALNIAAEADVVLMGRNLTEDGSLDMIRELRLRSRTRTTPIVVHSSTEDEQYVREALRAGAQAVVRAPYDYDSLFEVIQVLRPRAGPTGEPQPKYVRKRNEQAIIHFLRTLLEQDIPAVRPQHDPQTAIGFTYPLVEAAFDVPKERCVQILEELVADGLLDRKLTNKVNVCPACGWHTINFVELCPQCRSLDTEVQDVVHHFACAYVGAWSEFRKGLELVCPKCDKVLRHMGLDYDKPMETFVCNDCHHVFNEARIDGQCLHCGKMTPAVEIETLKVHTYMPNAKTNRAVAHGRLYGLDIRSVLYDDRSRTFRKDFLIFEIDREIYRARRYDSPLCLALLNVSGMEESPGARDPAVFAQVQNAVFEAVSGALRDLDILSIIDDGLAAVLLPETDPVGAVQLTERIRTILPELRSLSFDDNLSLTVAVAQFQLEHADGMEFFTHAHQVLLWALRNRPGTTVDAHEWRRATSSR
jgi:DNA-binding response OmpR family regulator/GGDEF domain-containing protein